MLDCLKKPARGGALVAVALSLGLAGCETTGQGAAAGAAIGGGIGAITCAATGASAGQCAAMIGGGALLGAIVGDAIEREQQKRVVYLAARSGSSASTGTFRNQSGKRVSYKARVTRTYKSTSDSGLTCRDVAYSKTVEGTAAGTGSDSTCQVRVAGKPTWEVEA